MNRAEHNAKDYLANFLPGLVALILDQTTKGLFSTKIFNDEIALSISFFSNNQNLQVIALAIMLIAIAMFSRWHIAQLSSAFPKIFYSVLLGAALSNWVDRIAFGGVRDVWEISFLNLHNNLADWLIVLSIIGIIVADFLEQRSHRLSKQDSS